MFACRWLLAGPLIQGRGGGFALGARSQVLGGSGVHVGLDYFSHGGIVVAHVSTSKTAPTAAIGLNRFGGRQAVHVALCPMIHYFVSQKDVTQIRQEQLKRNTSIYSQ